MSTPPSPEGALAASLAAAETLHRAGRLAEALAGYRETAARFPREAEPRFRMGLVEAQRGALDAASAHLRSALSLGAKPQHWLALGDVLERSGLAGEAFQAWTQAVRLAPGFAPAHARLGVALADARRSAEAVAAFRRAVAAAPRDARSWWNLGQTLAQLGEDAEAAAALEQVVSLQAENVQAWEALGRVLLRPGKVVQAREAYQRAVGLAGDRVGAWVGLASCESHLGRATQAVAALERAVALGPPDADRIASQRLIAMQYSPDYSPDAVFAAHVEWAQRHAPARARAPFPNRCDVDRPLNVGYLSPRFHEASVSYLTLPVLEQHDRASFRIHCYAEQAIEDEVTHRVRRTGVAWRSTLGLSDEAVADRIRADGIDILIDLAGHTPGHRLSALAHHPAPVIGTWLDYFNTTGMDSVDFLVSDPVHSPPGDRQRFVERVVHMPVLRYCWEPPAFAPEVTPPPACGGAAPVFGSFNRLAKVSDATLDAWCEILREVPEATLTLKNSALAGDAERSYVAARFAQRGIDPARITLRASSSHAAMLAEYGEIDVVLDTFPYNGGLTTLEALWMGRPVVTLGGEVLIGRQSKAIVQAIGLPEWCADDAAGYVRRAVDLARDTVRLEALSGALRDRLRRSSVMDAESFTRELEALYRAQWQRWCDAAGQQR